MLSLIGWWFLPSLVAGWTQSIWYSLTIRAGDPKPQPGHPRFARDRRTIQILVISLYLLYTIYEASWELRRQGNFYTYLGLPPTASDREIKSRFRRLAAVHHPDKAAQGTTSDGSEFIRLKIAADTLLNEASRFAYERFGPAVIEWKDCASRYEYAFRGTIMGVVPHYVIYAVVQYVLGFFGYLDFARYWRWFFLVAMAAFELHITTRPSSTLLSLLNPVLESPLFSHPPLLQFQLVALARRLCVTFYIALSQIGPLAFPSKTPGDSDKAVHAQIDRVTALANEVDELSGRLLDVELSPFKGDEEMLKTVRGKIAEWLVQNTIRADPMVKDAMGQSFRRRRVDAPAGAKGNR
ncbi:hypothetical protein SAPIO_CDS2643 [Scedosporium apiospermum]|uniref:J domain-containing protein n=1 Tax=Pseudallescheria apiosperma TaxID=563466 RepID=A0A084GCX6_PSEDA|nr:uncharacterized protein SAPIO_CDS2643 [Scedosporium apiospermum]KEZ45188.1 hypothetical protein SAPIO_CDS2643 [Scedosporium apiospermum]